MNKLVAILIIILLASFSGNAQVAKFQPPVEKCLLILGQDLSAIGGFSAPNNDGYTDHFNDIPAGFTTYTSLKYLEGLSTLTNYGAGDVCASCILDRADLQNTVLSIGLYLVGELNNINQGNHDSKITQLADWIKATNRPVFLRIGYEFNNGGNNYNASQYICAYQRIVDKFKARGVSNVAYVWQSDGTMTASQLRAWWPGDEYVDWLGYSHFHNLGQGILDIAREESKPVMIAEATPRGYNLPDVNGESVWDAWFQPLFNHIHDNKDIIQALCYINTNWDAQSMWQGMNWGDTRIQENPIVKENWELEIANESWMQQSDSLYDILSSVEIKKEISMEESCHFVKQEQGFKINMENNELGLVEICVYNLQGQKVEHYSSKKYGYHFQTTCQVSTTTSSFMMVCVSMNHQFIKSFKTIL